MASRKKAKQAAAAQRRQAARSGWHAPWVPYAGGAVVVVAVIAATVLLVFSGGPGASSASQTPSPTSSSSPTAAPNLGVLADASSTVTGATVDGIACAPSETTVYHIHAHLAVYVNGQLRTIPAGIGIVNRGTGGCLYSLHSHTPDGVIHIEAPVEKIYTLGDYFDIWGQPLSASHVGPITGTLIVYVNGQPYTGDPRSIPLAPHALIQIDIAQNTGPQPFTFPAGE